MPLKGMLLFFYPLLIISITGIYLIPFLKEYLKEVIAFTIFTVLCLGIGLLIPNKLKKIGAGVLAMLLAIMAFIKLSFYQLYGVKLSASALFVIFETNTNEASEFLESYLNLPIAILAIVIFVPQVWLLLKLKYCRLPVLSIKKNTFPFLFVITLIFGCSFLLQGKFKEQNILLSSISSYNEYLETKEILTSQLAKKENPLLKHTISSQENEVFVVVIGESTSSWHMQLYGYQRETTPKLTEIKNDLIVFDSVISPHVHTLLALEKILTLKNFENSSIVQNASVVQLANAAGFETYWISNQQPVGFHESLSTIIGSAAKHQYFEATENYKYTIYDEALLPIFDKVLMEKKKKKVIFLHLIGTHVAYNKRYPERFNVFKEPLNPKFSEDINDYINTYDNATLYNDYIIRQVIEKVKKLNTKSYVAYFSDHGDDVYDVAEMVGHNEYIASKPMYEVPFLIWFSEKYKERSQLFSKKKSIAKRRYNLEDFMFSFAEMSEINFNKMDSTRSIFNDHFQKRKRIIKEGEDYDKK